MQYQIFMILIGSQNTARTVLCACVEDREIKPYPGFYFSMWSFVVNSLIDSLS